jgi:hypothetical protein
MDIKIYLDYDDFKTFCNKFNFRYNGLNKSDWNINNIFTQICILGYDETALWIYETTNICLFDYNLENIKNKNIFMWLLNCKKSHSFFQNKKFIKMIEHLFYNFFYKDNIEIVKILYGIIIKIEKINYFPFLFNYSILEDFCYKEQKKDLLNWFYKNMFLTNVNDANKKGFEYYCSTKNYEMIQVYYIKLKDSYTLDLRKFVLKTIKKTCANNIELFKYIFIDLYNQCKIKDKYDFSNDIIEIIYGCCYIKKYEMAIWLLGYITNKININYETVCNIYINCYKEDKLREWIKKYLKNDYKNIIKNEFTKCLIKEDIKNAKIIYDDVFIYYNYSFSDIFKKLLIKYPKKSFLFLKDNNLLCQNDYFDGFLHFCCANDIDNALFFNEIIGSKKEISKNGNAIMKCIINDNYEIISLLLDHYKTYVKFLNTYFAYDKNKMAYKKFINFVVDKHKEFIFSRKVFRSNKHLIKRLIFRRKKLFINGFLFGGFRSVFVNKTGLYFIDDVVSFL